MTRLLCLDVGNQRIGLAIGDTSTRLAMPLRTFHRTSRPGDDIAALAAAARDEGAEAVVVGLPLLESGVEGEQARTVRAFVRTLAKSLDLPVHWQDERYTTFEAGQRLGPAGSSRRKQQRRRQEELDATAAAIILQTYLDGLPKEAARP